MLRINTDDLIFFEWAPDGEPRLSYNGNPFTGLALKLGEKSILKSESEYVNGYREGIQKEFYSSGQTSTIYTRKWSRYHGPDLEWHPNGVLKSENIWEFGHKISGKTFDENGNLISIYSINDHPERFLLWESDRQYFGSKS